MDIPQPLLHILRTRIGMDDHACAKALAATAGRQISDEAWLDAAQVWLLKPVSVYDSERAWVFREDPGLDVRCYDEAFTESLFSRLNLNRSLHHWFPQASDHWLRTGDIIHARSTDNYDQAMVVTDRSEVAGLLERTVTWKVSSRVWFVSWKGPVLDVTWREFLDHWDVFNFYDDENPFVLQFGTPTEAIMFNENYNIRHCRCE